MAQAPDDGAYGGVWGSYQTDFPGNGDNGQGYGELTMENLDPSLSQFSLSETPPQHGHNYPAFEAQGGSRPTSTQPYINSAFYPQNSNTSLGQGQSLSPNEQYISPTAGQVAPAHGTHGFSGHHFSSNIDNASAFAGSNGFAAGGAQHYQGGHYEHQYLQHHAFVDGDGLSSQQHGEYATAPSHFVNEPVPSNMPQHPGHLDQVWNGQDPVGQYPGNTMQVPQRDNSTFSQVSPYAGSRGSGGMPLTPSIEPHTTPTSAGQAHFQRPMHGQRDAADLPPSQQQWQSPQKSFASQQSSTYLQQSAPGGVHQVFNQPPSGRATPLQQQVAAPYAGHYNPAPTNNLTQLPPQSVSPSPGYVPQQQQKTQQASVPVASRQAQPQPASRLSAPQTIHPVNSAVPQDGGFIRSVPVPLPVPPKQLPNLPMPRVLPAFTSPAFQSENAKLTGSFFVAFDKQTISAANVPKHIRPFNPVAVDPEKRLGMCFPQKRLLPCEIIYQHERAGPEERRALEIQLKQQLGDPLPAQYRSILKGSDKSTAPSADQDQEDIEEPVQSDTRPEDANDAAAWDAIQIVDFDRVSSSDPINTRVGNAVAKLGELVRGFMAPVKSASDELDRARKAKKDSSEINRLKAEVVSKTPPLYRAIDAAEDRGDSQVLANLGGNQRLVVDLTSALRVGNNIGDHNGDFARAVLRLMSHSKTITDELLSKTNWPKVKAKFLEKGDGEVRELVKTIADNAAARSALLNKDKAPATAGTKQATTSTSQIKPPSTTTAKKMAPSDPAKKKPSTARVPSEPAPGKRSRDEDSDSSSRTVKKLATEPATASSQTAIKPPTIKSATSTANPASANQGKIWSGSALLPGKSKPVAKPAPKPAASKGDPSKPDLTKLPSFKKSDPAKVKKPDVAKTDASQSSSSKLGALLEEIYKPKAAKAAQAVATPDSGNDAPETPEEKQRRLRKEQRRKLRVSWKEGDELTQVRIFHKDIAEDEGRAGNMIRDARDDRSEGMVLKQGMKLDEEEEEEIPYRPWFEPLAVSFDNISQEKRDQSFSSRGGNQEIHTPQQDFIAERENRELMVIYTDPADIPPTPKSPPPSQQDRDTTSAGVSVVNTVAENQEIQRRWNEAAHMGLSWALYNAMRRAEEQKTRVGDPLSRTDIDATALLSNLGSMALQNSQGSTQPVQRSTAAVGDPLATAASRDAQVFALLTSDKLKQWKDPDPYNPAYPKTHRRHDYPNPEVQKAADAIEAVAEQLRGKPFPPAEPPAWLASDQARIDEWYHGYNKDRQRAHEEQLRAQTAAGHLTQPQTAAPSGAANNQNDMAAILAYYAQFNQPQGQNTAQQQDAWAQYYQSMYQQAQQSTQQTPAMQPAVDPQIQALLATMGAGQQGAPAPASAAAADPQLQALLAGLASSPQGAQPYQGAQAANIPSANDPNYAAYVTAMSQWAAGQSQSGGNTQVANTSAYDQQRQQKAHSGSRSASGAHNGAKSSASNKDNSIPPHLRGINRDKIGTKPCVFWANGTCNKGDKCTFRHD